MCIFHQRPFGGPARLGRARRHCRARLHFFIVLGIWRAGNGTAEMSGKHRRAGEVVHPPTARPERRVGNFLHGRVACPYCQAHNDALARTCTVCAQPLPADLQHLADDETSRCLPGD
jgi:hypothetical protein